MLVVEREAPEFGVAGFAGGVEDDVGVVGRQADAFGLVHDRGDILALEDAFLLEVHYVKVELMGLVAIGKIGVAAADDASLPNVNPFIQTGNIEDVGIRQMDFSVPVRVREARKAELLQQLVAAVPAAIRVDEPILRVEAPGYTVLLRNSAQVMAVATATLRDSLVWASCGKGGM